MDPERVLGFAYGGVLIVSIFLFFVISRAAIRELRQPPLARNPTFVIAVALVVQCVALTLVGFVRVDDHFSHYPIVGRWPLTLCWATVLLLIAKIGFHWASTIGRRSWQWWLAILFLAAWGFYCFVI